MEDKIYVNSYTILSSSIFQNQPGRHHRLTDLKQKFTKHEINTYTKKRDHIREGLKKTFHLIWLQFSDTMISQIESISGFKKNPNQRERYWFTDRNQNRSAQVQDRQAPGLCFTHGEASFYLTSQESRSNKA